MEVILSSVVVVSSCEYYGNLANVSGGAIVTDETSQLTDSGGQFINNRAETGGALSAARSTVVFRDSIFSNNQATESGGAIYTIQSELFFHGLCNLIDNFASTGGAMYATESTLDVCTSGHFFVMLNIASDSGGGLYLYHSNLNCRYSSFAEISGNLANNSGGGIHATNSLVTAYYNRRYSKSPDGYIQFLKTQQIKEVESV